MGYTTEFKGAFDITPPMSIDTYARIMDLADDNCRKETLPSALRNSCCQWVSSRDGTKLKWDGGEKFYDYVEWAQFIIDNILTPAGCALSGSVDFQGEERKDRGTLSVVDGKVVKQRPSVPLASKIEPHAHTLFALVEDAMGAGNELGSEWNQRAYAVVRAIRGAK